MLQAEEAGLVLHGARSVPAALFLLFAGSHAGALLQPPPSGA